MIEERIHRLSIINKLGGDKSRLMQNKFGQFATPVSVASEIIRYSISELRMKEFSYLEPGFGTGAFYNELMSELSTTKECNLLRATGYEIDSFLSAKLKELYGATDLNLRFEDFLTATPEPYDLILCNPPYIRHHHLDVSRKKELASEVNSRYKIQTTGYTGLYNYFMMLGERWLSNHGLAAWLVPVEFLDVNYGVAVKDFLLNHVQLSHIHLYTTEELQFSNALVSTAVVFYRKGKPFNKQMVRFSYGNSLLDPLYKFEVSHDKLDINCKWSREIKGARFVSRSNNVNDAGYVLKDFFDIKRGIATGNNGFFILPDSKARELMLEKETLTPVLPSPKLLKTDVIEADENGAPINVVSLHLLNCTETEEVLQKDSPNSWKYLQTGLGSVSERYLCRSRRHWYLQESRQAAPILCSYMGRSRSVEALPFRFVLNKSRAIATNAYLMLYPKGILKDLAASDPSILVDVWRLLNEISGSEMVNQGRTYGGGLEKIEPSELAKLPVDSIAQLLIGTEALT